MASSPEAALGKERSALQMKVDTFLSSHLSGVWRSMMQSLLSRWTKSNSSFPTEAKSSDLDGKKADAQKPDEKKFAEGAKKDSEKPAEKKDEAKK
jgi:hypothetical protein